MLSNRIQRQIKWKCRGDSIMPIEMTVVHYKNFGQCVKLENGLIEAIVTVDIGPRIIRFALKDGENFFHEDTERESAVTGQPLEAIFGEHATWYSYGGHRLWLSPEDMPLTYYPDNDPVHWERISGGIALTPPPQRVTDVQTRIELVMHEDKAEMQVRHFATNIGHSTKKRSLWALTVPKRGGLELIPQPTVNTVPLPNRVLALWPYSKMSDERVFWGEKYITLRQDADIKKAFKFGLNNDRGWAAYFVNNGLFVKKYNHNPNGRYPDFGVSFETYTNNQVLEMETLGELADLAPGSTGFHSEEWMLFDKIARPAPNDETTFDAIANRYIEHWN